MGRKGRRGENKLVGEGFKALASELEVPSLLLLETSLPGGHTGLETPPLHLEVRRPFSPALAFPSLLGLLSPFSWCLSIALQRRLFSASPGFPL